MNGLAAFLLATPIFGLSLTPPSALPLSVPAGAPARLAGLPAPLWLDLDGVADGTPAVPADDADGAGDDGDAERAEAAPEVPPSGEGRAVAAAPAGHGAAVEMSEEDRRFLEEVRLRRDLGGVHRILGISTFISMTFTAIFGFIQYYDLYGIQAARADAPCTTGTAVFQEFCAGDSWPHRISVIGTSALYTATFALSLAMPDPNHVSEGTGQFAERIRAHQILRWIHLVGMVAQTVMGLGVANGWFGDRANDYETLQIVAGVHQAIGWTTWFTVGLAGAIMLF